MTLDRIFTDDWTAARAATPSKARYGAESWTDISRPLERSHGSSSCAALPAAVQMPDPLNTIDAIVDEWGEQSFPASDPPSDW